MLEGCIAQATGRPAEHPVPISISSWPERCFDEGSKGMAHCVVLLAVPLFATWYLPFTPTMAARQRQTGTWPGFLG